MRKTRNIEKASLLNALPQIVLTEKYNPDSKKQVIKIFISNIRKREYFPNYPIGRDNQLIESCLNLYKDKDIIDFIYDEMEKAPNYPLLSHRVN